MECQVKYGVKYTCQRGILDIGRHVTLPGFASGSSSVPHSLSPQIISERVRGNRGEQERGGARGSSVAEPFSAT